ncbi:hypothetical protein ACN27F_06180 [Solwaraspora sp. WMMB335]|uniref:hypothetical protein n=1 Tax=Solwaraspora sp. WMMB335 TaxID=3404118 RepID=UPI003B93ADE6
MSGTAEPIPYREMTDPGYAQAAAQSFTVTEVSLGTLVLRGPCPRCHAVIDIPLVHEIFRSSRLLINPNPPAYRPGPRDEYVEPMMCTCVDAHPDRPDDQYGCGAYWTLTITKRPS